MHYVLPHNKRSRLFVVINIRRKAMKKLVALLLAVLMIACVFAGWAKPADKPADAPADAPADKPADAPDIDLTVNGGTLSALDTVNGFAVYSYSYGQSFANVDVAIAGGTFNGHVVFGGGSLATHETVTITGGTFNGKLGRYVEDDGTNYGWADIAKP